MKILIAPDKFKGSLTAAEVCAAIGRGLRAKFPTATIVHHPLADGGDGSLAVIADHLQLERQRCQTVDALQRPLAADYFTTTATAFIELATASGLASLPSADRNPLFTTSLGTGQLIADAISKGFRNIYLFLGGSATNDAGIGIAAALGFHFLDEDHQSLLPIGKNLEKITRIVAPVDLALDQLRFTLLCDVQNPFFGPSGAAPIYAPQKGANLKEVAQLDKGLRQFAGVLEKWKGVKVNELPGSGAAGGIAGGLAVLLNATIENGFEAIAALTQFESQLRSADLVISGEGKLDRQSMQGKVVQGVAKYCQQHKKPLSLCVGKNELSESELGELGAQQLLSMIEFAKDEAEAMNRASEILERMVNEKFQLD